MLPRLVAILTLATICLSAQTKQKVILDTDIGSDIDDAWALAAVARHPAFQTLAVTITDGDTKARARVACKLLTAAQRTDIPVYVGRPTPPPSGEVDHQFSWAEDFTAYAPKSETAAQAIVRLIRRYPGEITLLAVGPLQNVADALRIEPKLPKLVKRLVLMSGNVYGQAGNQKVIAEWNVIRSISDAQLVYSGGFPITIVPLDSTTLVQLSDFERDRVAKRNSKLSNALEQLYRLWLVSPVSRMTLHDQLAVGEAANPGNFFARVQTLNLYVDNRGFTRVDPNRGKPVHVCFEPHRDDFLSWYLGVLLK